jgi:putative lipoprotein
VRRLLGFVLVLPLVVVACASGNKPTAPPSASPAPAAALTAVPTPSGPAAQKTPPFSELRPMDSITGTVTYRLRTALTPEAEVQIELRDVSRADAEAPLIAKRVIEKPGQVPIAFTLDYDTSLIVPGHSYAVSARISDRGQLQFVTDTRVAVFGAGPPEPVEIVVVPVR